MSQNSLGSGILEKQGVAWRSWKRTYLIIRFVGNSLGLLRFLFVSLAKFFFFFLICFFGFFCLGRKAEFKSWPSWVEPHRAFSEREPRLGLCVGTASVL